MRFNEVPFLRTCAACGQQACSTHSIRKWLGAQREAKGEDEEEDGMDPDMAAAMGFAGFSGGR